MDANEPHPGWITAPSGSAPPLYPVHRPGRRGPVPVGAFVAVPTGGATNGADDGADGGGAAPSPAPTVVFAPVVDVNRIALTGIVAGVTAGVAISAAVAAGVALRRPPAIHTVTMGHGGWVSLKNVAGRVPVLHSPGGEGRRPWWARLLGAHRLVVAG